MSLYDVLRDGSEDGGDKLSGVFIGIVTSLNDKEGLGRVKVKFPWRECNDESYWARVATMAAGKDRGSYFQPEVEDEVLVAFVNGNINDPYIIGCLWNGNDKPPVKDSEGKNNIRKIKSRSGHEIIFNDDNEKKEEKLEVHSKSGHSIVLDDSDKKEKITITDKTGKNKIIIDSVKNSLTIESVEKLKIKSKEIEIEADLGLKIKAGATLDIQGTLVKIN